MSPIAEMLARFVLALDDHDWDGVTTALAETVHRDYTSLFGGEPDEISGPALAAEWKSAITGLDAHQHLLGLDTRWQTGDSAVLQRAASRG